MPGPKGNQPSSSGSNYNQRNTNKTKVPVKNKKLKATPYKKVGLEAQKRVDNKQTAVINRLSKQVYQLKMSSYGKVQQNYHQMTNTLFIEKDRPICLDITDFTCERGPEIAGVPSVNGAALYQLTPPASAPSELAFWKPKPIDPTYGQNHYWHHQNQDQPDTGAYLCVNATYFVEVKGLPNADNVRVRFDIISQKMNAVFPATAIQLPSTPLSKVLPDTLKDLRNLADPTINRINPVYFKKYMSKTIFINSTKSADTKGTTANIHRFSFTIRPNKLCIQSQTNPQVGGGIVINDNPPPDSGEQQEVSRGNFGPRNVPINQPLWLLVSGDNALADPTQQRIQLNMSRRVVFRDHLGSSNL